MSTIDLKYSIDDIDIIDPVYDIICNKKDKSKEIIDLFPYINDNGKKIYIDEISLDEKIEEHKREVLRILDEIRRNNPLNFEFSLDKSKIVTTDYEDLNDDRIYVDYDGFAKKSQEIAKKKKFGYSLKKIACAIGIALGITAAIKSVAHFHMNTHNHVTVENTKENSSTKEGIKIKKNLKIKQTSKQNTVKKLKLGNTFKLKNAKLSYTSLGDEPSVNTSNLDCKQFKIKYISIISSNKVVDVIKVNQENENMDFNEFEKNCHKTYGKKCNLSYGVYNAKDKNKVVIGWNKDQVKKLTKRISKTN